MMADILMEKCMAAKGAFPTLSTSKGSLRNKAISLMADALERDINVILEANGKDIENAKANGIRPAMIDRLLLTEDRIKGIAASLRKVSALPDPLGGGELWSRPNGMSIRRVKVPIGLIAIIYEARPNVTADAAAICIKSGNCCVLRGGKEAVLSSVAIVNSVRSALKEAGLPEDCVQVIEDTTRESSNRLMTLNGVVDLLIPRGGRSLIRAVVDNATVPVIETGAGNCHVYVEKHANMDMALELVYNAKTHRPSVCNAAESLLVDRAIATEFLPKLKEKMGQVEFRGCEETLAILPDITPASDEDFYTEYNDLIMSVKIVEDVEEAITHINSHNTKHSELIVTDSVTAADRFTAAVDAAAVYVNVSTRFTDGEEFGFGAEIGISTQKFHVRGPMGPEALTTSKYVIEGNGQIR
ncbi:MAG: glutamate-5-semialdehyde dehydrogenase [Clostridia bacterium]|nr:glutamate-5-semialdehyde dehydrogenase [Clostridia bacterium]